MDIQEVVATLKPNTPGLRLRQGLIVSVQADSTCTVTIAGSSVQVPGVKVMGYPVPGASCQILVDGRDLFILGTLAPAAIPFIRLRAGDSQSIGDNTWTALNFGSSPAEITDPYAMYSPASPSLVTVIVPGLYAVDFGAVFTGHVTGVRRASIYKSGTPQIYGSTPTVGGSSVTQVPVSAMFACAAGDTIAARVLQSSGGSLALSAAAGENVLTVAYLGPSGV